MKKENPTVTSYRKITVRKRMKMSKLELAQKLVAAEERIEYLESEVQSLYDEAAGAAL